MPIKNIQNPWTVKTVQTTDATLTTVSAAAVTLDSAAAAYLECRIMAYRPSTGDSAVWNLSAGGKRFGAGASALISTVLELVGKKDAGAATWLATLIANNNDIVPQITGQVGATIEWMIEVRSWEYQP